MSKYQGCIKVKINKLPKYRMGKMWLGKTNVKNVFNSSSPPFPQSSPPHLCTICRGRPLLTTPAESRPPALLLQLPLCFWLACSFLICPPHQSQMDLKKPTNLILSRVLKLLYKIQTLHYGLEGPCPPGPCWPLLLFLSILTPVKLRTRHHGAPIYCTVHHSRKSLKIISTI